jgi:flagellin-specific chaperone FliS
MRGGKRQGAGRKPRFGQYKETATMRVPVQLKQQIIAFIEDMCRKDAQANKDFVTQSDTKEVQLRDEKISQAKQILNQSLELKANAGGAIKNEIRKALKILEL